MTWFGTEWAAAVLITVLGETLGSHRAEVNNAAFAGMCYVVPTASVALAVVVYGFLMWHSAPDADYGEDAGGNVTPLTRR